MPKLQAAVPAGAPPNALLRVRLPDGTEVNVRVPEGLKPGDEFVFEVLEGAREVTTSAASSGAGSSSGGSGSGAKSGGKKGAGKQSRNPKKRRGHHRDNSDLGGSSSHGRDRDLHLHREPQGLLGGFLSIYNQVYDILSGETRHEPPSAAASPTASRLLPLTRQGSRGRATPSPVTVSPQHPVTHQLTRASTASVGFLDRELASWRDFMTALAVGSCIGFSIVLGFVVGVLHVTPIEEEATST
ncbi:hypothetical protein ACHAXT_003346 [Thalassiosira profunda]